MPQVRDVGGGQSRSCGHHDLGRTWRRGTAVDARLRRKVEARWRLYWESWDIDIVVGKSGLRWWSSHHLVAGRRMVMIGRSRHRVEGERRSSLVLRLDSSVLSSG